jgi:hypothetical protein
MNCRPGDLAVVVRAEQTPTMTGRFVIVDRLAVPGEVIDGVRWIPSKDYGSCWVIRPAAGGSTLPFVTTQRGVVQVAARPFWDCGLRPIRPNEGEDESMSWARPRIEEPA